MDEAVKICNRCNKSKPLVAFRKVTLTAFRTACRECENTKSRAYYANRPPEVKKHRADYRREYNKANPEYQREYREKYFNENPVKIRFKEYKHNDKTKNREFSIPYEMFEDMCLDNCYHCGAEPDPINGIDRVDNTKGHTPDNVVTACTICNLARRNQTLPEFEQWLEQITAHRIKLRSNTNQE